GAARGRRYTEKGRVGVPEGFAITEPADRLAVLDDVRDDRNLRRDLALAPGGLGFDAVLFLDQLRGVEFQFAELTRERHVLPVGHRLVAETQHEVIEPGLPDRVAVLGRQRLADIDAADLGAAPGTLERNDLHAHRSTPPLRRARRRRNR